MQAQTEVATGKKATDLRGFGNQADVLTAARSVQARVESFIDNGKSLAARLETQNLGLERVSDAVGGARQAIAEAIASGRGPTLMQELDSWLASTTQSLNMKHDGRYLFSGSNTDNARVIDNLDDCGAWAFRLPSNRPAREDPPRQTTTATPGSGERWHESTHP